MEEPGTQHRQVSLGDVHYRSQLESYRKIHLFHFIIYLYSLPHSTMDWMQYLHYILYNKRENINIEIRARENMDRIGRP